MKVFNFSRDKYLILLYVLINVLNFVDIVLTYKAVFIHGLQEHNPFATLMWSRLGYGASSVLKGLASLAFIAPLAMVNVLSGSDYERRLFNRAAILVMVVVLVSYFTVLINNLIVLILVMFL